MLSDTTITEALRNVQDPELHRDIVSLDMVKEIHVDGTAVALKVDLTTPACPLKDQIGADIESRIKELGATDVLNKPVDPSELVLRLRNALAVKAYHDQLAHFDSLTGLPTRTACVSEAADPCGSTEGLEQPQRDALGVEEERHVLAAPEPVRGVARQHRGRGQPRVGVREAHRGRHHAEALAPMVEFVRGQAGVELADVIPGIGSVADEICFVRSMHTGHNNHTEGLVMFMTGRVFQGRPTMGSWMGSDFTNDDLVRDSSLRKDFEASLIGKSESPEGWIIEPILKLGEDLADHGRILDTGDDPDSTAAAATDLDVDTEHAF